MRYDLSHLSDRVDIYKGDIEIEHVHHSSENEYVLEYSFDWSIYNGCADMDESGVERNTVTFEVSENGELAFDDPCYIPPSREFDH